MNLKKEFDISNDYTEEALIGELGKNFDIVKDQTAVNRLVFFDTFDWRLFKESLLLYKSESELFLRCFSDNEILFHQPLSSQPRFIWDFPDNELKEYLESII